MALIEHDLFRGRIDRVAIAIDRLRTFEPPEGYYVADSFGKDSCVIVRLTEMSGVKADYHHNLTTVDAPELVWFGKKTHLNTIIHRPELTMWQLIRKKHMPPTRLKRYCCEYLKERGGAGRFVITGIRAQESPKRALRQMTHTCYKDSTKHYLHPIIDWTIDDVWQFIKENNIPYCSLYDEGWKRLGCVLCPFSNQKLESKRWPKITESYHRAILRSFVLGDQTKKGLKQVKKCGKRGYQAKAEQKMEDCLHSTPTPVEDTIRKEKERSAKRKGVKMEPYKAEDVIPIVAKMNGPRGGAYHPCRIKNCEHKQQNGRCRYKPEYKEGKETCLMFIRKLKRSEYIEPHWCDKFEGHR